MHLLFPGRHHLLTDYQFKYLFNIIQNGIEEEYDVNGRMTGIGDRIEDVIFAVTSSNHSNTRRNPLPFHLRVMAIQLFAHELDANCYIFGIDDVGHMDDFADYMIKKISHESDYRFNLDPSNTAVMCSTPVLEMYSSLGFTVLPAELSCKTGWKYDVQLPWELVEKIAHSKTDWRKDRDMMMKVHPASLKIWKEYFLGEKVKFLFEDRMIGDDGDITTTRDYNSYVRQMDEIAQLKYDEVKEYVKPGRIGDIGCAVGSWIKLACDDGRLRESDFYGIEVARHLYDICCQRKQNGEFPNQSIFFSQKNAVTGLVFREISMNTIHTSSLTHEIYSYGSYDDLIRFISNRHKELVMGGVWINRDVVGPENKDEPVYMELNENDGSNDREKKEFGDQTESKSYLQGLSTYSRFLKFAGDFRKESGCSIGYEIVKMKQKKYVMLKLRDACEFMEKKDYVDNWRSEMHETFCYWDFTEWKKAMTDAGFEIAPGSKTYRNEWIVKNRFAGKVKLYVSENGDLKEIDFPVTHMIMIGRKV
jgi:hypothetical protein